MRQSTLKPALSTGRFALCLALIMMAGSSWASKPGACYVTGDTSKNKTKKAPGSVQNPYGSLAEVEADPSCEQIIVRWSDTALDGGIALQPGQTLEGKKGPGGAYPVITNSNLARVQGVGVLLSSDNVISQLHIKDAFTLGVGGYISGNITIHNIRISGSGQAGVADPATGSGFANLAVAPVSDSNISIERSDFEGSDGAGMGVYPFAGFSQILIKDVNVRDQGDLTADGWGSSPGIVVQALYDASANVDVIDSSVHNIGRGFSNSDGLALLNYGSGDLVANVGGYSYLNPDGDGGGSATGMEIGIIHGAQGSFTASVSNSVIEGSTSCGIQVLDLDTTVGANTLDVTLQDNLLVSNLIGICGWQDETPFSDFSLNMQENEIFDSTLLGVLLSVWGPISTFDVFMEKNTIANSGDAGLAVQRGENFTGSINIDAGLGALGSSGENRITGSGVDDVWSWNMDVTAANNWWGSATGPSSVQALEGATVVVDPFLTADPK